MERRTQLLLILALGFSLAEAVSVNPQREVVVQPDGTAVEVLPVGDEFNLWWELPTGETVLFDTEGFVRLAVLDQEGRLAFGPRVHAAGAIGALSAWPKHLRPNASGWGFGERLPVLPFSRPAGVQPVSTAQVQAVLVILVAFTDRQPVSSQPSDFAGLFFSGERSARAYFSQATLGKVTLQPAAESHGTANDGVVGWLSLNMPHPNRGITGSKDPSVTDQQKKEAAHRMRLAVKAAIEAADPFVNFSLFDTDRNGAISRRELALVVVTAGYESSFGGYNPTYSPANWGHRWSLGNFNDGVGVVPGPVVDGVRVGDYADDGGYTSFGEWMQSNSANGHRSTVGIVVHELGHDTLGLPDLYDTDGSSAGVGGFCLMGSGSWGCEPPCYGGEVPVLLSAWSRVVTEVAPLRDVQGTQTVRLGPAASSGEAVRLGTGLGNEYFLLEQRRAEGFDRGLLRWDNAFANTPGLAIWHVDESRTTNADEARRLVDLEEANGLEPLNEKSNNFSFDMLFRPGMVARFADDTTPASRRQTDSATTGVAVETLAWEGNALAVRVVAPNPVGVPHDRCDSAVEVPLAVGETYQWQGWVAQATGGDLQAACAPLSKTAFWRLTPRRTGKLTVRASGFDTVAQLFGASCSTPIPLACNDDVDQTGASELPSVPVRRGEPVYLMVGRYGSGRSVGGELALTVTLAPADPLLVQVVGVQGCPLVALALRVTRPSGPLPLPLGPEHFRVFAGAQELPIRGFTRDGVERYWVWVQAPGEGQLRVEVDSADASGQAEAVFSCTRTPRRLLRPLGR